MKRLATLILIAVSTMFSNSSQAQSAQMVKLDGVNITPTTVITTIFTVKRESIRSGPYARFSQKFLGVIAPLTDKDIYTIVDSKLSSSNGEPTNIASSCISGSELDNSIEHFSKITEDRISNIMTSPEDMARKAANTIFSLRRSRLDLITGEAGENVFNEGLKYALIEINQLEEDILALFLGKHMVNYETRVFSTTPERDKSTNIIARFSTTNGVVDASDLSGQPIALNVQIVNEAVAVQKKQTKKSSKNMEQFLIPAQTICHLFNGSDLLAKLDIQIYQLGEVIELPTLEYK